MHKEYKKKQSVRNVQNVLKRFKDKMTEWDRRTTPKILTKSDRIQVTDLNRSETPKSININIKLHSGTSESHYRKKKMKR